MERIIVFRADGSPTIGMGHFTRTLALAEMLNEYFYCVFATKSPTNYQIDEIEKVCHSRIDLPDDETHFDTFINLLKGNEMVVVDNYYFTTGYQRAIKEKGCKLVCIDDLHDQVFYADLIINHTQGAKAEAYRAQPYTQFALGPEYALIRQAFSNAKRNEKRIVNIETLFICFGGSDPKNLTESIVDVLHKYFPLQRIIVVVGDRYSHITQLTSKKKRLPNVELYQNIDAERMAELMSESDLAIIPASGTLLEAMKVGLPVITGFYVPNQETAAKNISESGLAWSCGDMLINFPENLKKLLDALSTDDLNGMLAKQKTIFIDNKETYLKLMQKLASEKSYSFENFTSLTPGEKELVWRWRNHEAIRKWMYNTSVIPNENHLTFIENLKTDTVKTYLLVKRDTIPIGVISFTLVEDGVADLGFYLGPEYHHKKLSAEFYYYILEYVFEVLHFRKVIGYVHIENNATLSLLELFGHVRQKVKRTVNGKMMEYYLCELTVGTWKEVVKKNKIILQRIGRAK
jgi:UDP-2,4-diacetamido-2,4,6-trideoxy-beta-L-altropyranose hydrolase/UDP-4-amino-4,6-dideoxy-N-acetyl-beta-L-altrosamine N-acetyltransferase